MTENKLTKKNTIVPLIFGIIGIFFTSILLSPIFGIVFGIIGMILAKQNKKKDKISKIAFILCLIALIIALVMFTIATCINVFHII